MTQFEDFPSIIKDIQNIAQVYFTIKNIQNIAQVYFK